MLELRMVYLSVFFFILIFHLAQSQDSCPKEFPCGSLGNVSFPFTRSSQPSRGLYTINCDVTPNPEIYLGGNNFTALSQSDQSFQVLDLQLQDLFANKSCRSFDTSLSYPSSPSISFRTIERNLTLFRCSQNTNDHYFRGYNNYSKCREFSIYYNYTRSVQEGYLGAPKGDIPDNCSLIQLPIKWPSRLSTQNGTDLFDLLTAKFKLRWSLSDNCNRCHVQGGRCSTDSSNNFHCSSNPKGKQKSKRILVIVLPAVFGLNLAICLSFIVIWRFKKREGSCSYFFTRNSYSDSSRQDLEGGGSKYFGVHVFSYSTLEEATNRFDSSKELGDGGFGTVYHGELRDGREVAVKRLYEQNSKRMEQFRNEIEILTRLRHQNLVTLYGCTSRHSRELLLVYEYIPNGTVADHLHGDKAKHRTLTWSIRMNIAIETARALAYLHASDIVHRDVKTSNILLDNNFCVKVADFGLSRLFPSDVTHISTAPQGTPGYVDPEYHACYQLTNKSDVYSFGVVLVELISSLPAVDIRRQRDEITLANFAMSKILKCAFEELIDPSLGYEIDAEIRRMTCSVAELAFQCLQLEKKMRPTMEEVLEILKAIQKGEFEKEKKEEINVIDNDPSYVIVPSAPESENDEQLMKSQLRPSPNYVNDKWVSVSTTASNSG